MEKMSTKRVLFKRLIVLAAYFLSFFSGATCIVVSMRNIVHCKSVSIGFIAKALLFISSEFALFSMCTYIMLWLVRAFETYIRSQRKRFGVRNLFMYFPLFVIGLLLIFIVFKIEYCLQFIITAALTAGTANVYGMIKDKSYLLHNAFREVKFWITCKPGEKFEI